MMQVLPLLCLLLVLYSFNDLLLIVHLMASPGFALRGHKIARPKGRGIGGCLWEEGNKSPAYQLEGLG